MEGTILKYRRGIHIHLMIMVIPDIYTWSNNLLPNTYYNINLRARYNNGNIGDITPKSFTTLVGNPPTPLTPFIKDNTLYWNETSNINGDILFYNMDE